MVTNAAKLKRKIFPYMLIAPMFILFLTFIIWPVISSFMISFQTFTAGKFEFVGLENFKRLLGDPIFWKSLKNTFFILIIQVPIMLFLAIVLAVMVNSKVLKGRAVFRTSIFIPTVTSLVAYSIVFSILLMNRGFLNYALGLVGIDPIPWLTDGFWAKIAIILGMTWRWTGYNSVIYLGALQNIPYDVYEAANIDGANKRQQFFKITIPLLKPVILFTSIFSIIGTLQLFDEPYNLTRGGPNNETISMGMYLYNNAFLYFDFGYASAIAWAIVILVAILSFINFKVTGSED